MIPDWVVRVIYQTMAYCTRQEPNREMVCPVRNRAILVFQLDGGACCACVSITLQFSAAVMVSGSSFLRRNKEGRAGERAVSLRRPHTRGFVTAGFRREAHYTRPRASRASETAKNGKSRANGGLSRICPALISAIRAALFVRHDVDPFHQQLFSSGRFSVRRAAATMGSHSWTYFFDVWVFSQNRFMYFSAISGDWRDSSR